MFMDFKLILRPFSANFNILFGHDARIAPSSDIKIASKNPLNLNSV